MDRIALDFAPLLPWWLLAGLAVVALVLTAPALIARARGSVLRLVFLATLLAALFNPQLVREERRPLDDITLAIVDRSASNRLGDRAAEAEAALSALRDAVADKGGTLKVVDSARDDGRSGIFAPLLDALGEVAPDRLSAIVVISDGRIDDAARAGAVAAAGRPVHALLTGDPDLPDRRLEVLEAPEFALVDRPVTLRLRVREHNLESQGPIALGIRRVGAPPEQRLVHPDEPIDITLTPERRGTLLVEATVAAAPGERVLVNNRALFSINAVRDRLRVLLVSGEPHPGERVWRDTLKADPAVDLIHFTILRLPTSQDPTPVSQLSLIPFPTERLFAEQLHDFDLVIFDRYALRGVLEPRYFSNLLAYVEAGGALFIANGPEFAGRDSLAGTALGTILPALPAGEVLAQDFTPALTPLGRRHPVTAALPGSTGEGKRWGPWFRLVPGRATGGRTLLDDGSGRPLLILDHAGEGRVAELMSDQIWLWARGVAGGGPYQELLRRTVHWLMKEPDLEEEALLAHSEGDHILVERRSLGQETTTVTLTRPDGTRETVALTPGPDGIARGRVAAPELGFYRLSDGPLEAVAGVGPMGGHELSEVVPSDAVLGPLARATGGGVFWLKDGMPDIRRTASRAAAAGRGWLGLPRRGASRSEAVQAAPMLPAWLWALLLASLLGLTWWRESR